MLPRESFERRSGSLEPLFTVWSILDAHAGPLGGSPDLQPCPVLLPVWELCRISFSSLCLRYLSPLSPLPFPGECLWLHHGRSREVLGPLL